MKKRLLIVAALLAALAVPVNLPAAESACGPDFDKRAAMHFCRIVRKVAGHDAWRTCVQVLKVCEKEGR